MLTYEDINRQLPWRELDWRWKRAGDLAEAHGPLKTERDDPDTLRVAAYRRAGPIRGEVDFPDVHAAWQLHDRSGPVRLELQARLLAQQTPAAAAARMTLDPAAVAQYERQHFHVTDRFDAADWVITYVIRPHHAVGRRAVATALLLRNAYHGGPDVVDALAPLLAGDLGWVDQPIDPAEPLRAKVRWLLAVEELPLTNPAAVKELLNLLEECPDGTGRANRDPLVRGLIEGLGRTGKSRSRGKSPAGTKRGEHGRTAMRPIRQGGEGSGPPDAGGTGIG